MNFDFSETAGLGQSNAARLNGNAIHTVKFLGCEARDIQGVQDPTKVFKVLDIKFGNDEGTFTHTIWEPRDSDFEDPQGPYGPNPSNVKAMMALCKHLIDAVNPELGKKIDTKEVKLAPSSWDALRQTMVDYTKDFVNTETKIKLMTNNKGEAAFPSFFMAYNRSGKAYMRTNFIGDKVYFLNKELDRIKKQSEAKPTTMGSESMDLETTKVEAPDNTFDLDI